MTTADGLLKQVFTKINPRLTDSRAVSYITKKDKIHGDGFTATETATYIAWTNVGAAPERFTKEGKTPGPAHYVC
jgi:hypothetical protein